MLTNGTNRIDDEIDCFVADDSDLASVLVFNLLRTHSHLSPSIDAGLRAQELTSAQLNALLVLRQAGESGMLMGEIGRKLIVTKSNVTGLVDRLERQGLAERVEHRDRRATIVRLTAAGADLLERIAPPHARLLTELTSGLTVAEKQTLIRLLTKLRRELRHRLVAATPASPGPHAKEEAS